MAQSRIGMITACVLAGMLSPLAVSAAEPLKLSADVAAVLSARYPRNAEQLKLIQQQVQRVSKLAMPATVGITVGQGMGSGVIVSSDGLVLTAAHVIGGDGRRATILLPDGRRLRARTLGANHEIDAGMIRITNPPTDLPYLPVAKSEAEIGQWVITLGQPGGTVDDRSPPLRLGRILGVGDDWVCTDCTLVGGDSGGPLINLRGEVMAVHSSIGPEIVHNFHIPVTRIKNGWDRLLAGEVWGNELQEVLRTRLRPIMGIAGETRNGKCHVEQVYRDLPAFDAGIREGDVIVEIDGEQIISFEGVSSRVRKKKPGQRMRLKIERDGKTFDVELTLAGLRRAVPRERDDEQQEGNEP